MKMKQPVSDRTSASTDTVPILCDKNILLRLTPLELAHLAHLLPGNYPMEPVWDHTGAEGRSVLRLKPPTQVHHQSRKLV